MQAKSTTKETIQNIGKMDQQTGIIVAGSVSFSLTSSEVVMEIVDDLHENLEEL